MSDNPFQSPQNQSVQKPPVIGVLSGQQHDLRSVAVFQKAIMICILVYVGTVIASIVMQQIKPSFIFAVLIGAIAIATALTGSVFVFMLSIKVYGTGVGVLLGILSLVPCVGLIVLLVVNGKATNILKANGYNVGFLGADLSKVPK